jgi:hypothetical protein
MFATDRYSVETERGDQVTVRAFVEMGHTSAVAAGEIDVNGMSIFTKKWELQ